MSSLIETARLLASARANKPSQPDLRRAASTAYYALFDVVARLCADGVAGRSVEARHSAAWLRVYRAVEHRDALAACKALYDAGDELEPFAKTFVALYEKRREADYNPQAAAFSGEEVQGLITRAEAAIATLRSLKGPARSGLVSEILFRRRR
jgi:uncharacterized protein (UPF0332 family)